MPDKPASGDPENDDELWLEGHSRFEIDDRDYAHFYFDDYDLDAQLLAIRAALSAGRRAAAEQSQEILDLAERAKTLKNEHLVGMWTDEMHASVYQEAARSAAAVGMLAPFVENLFVGIFRGIGRMGKDVVGLDASSERSTRLIGMFWDPHFYFGPKGPEENLVQGIMQLADAAGLAPHLPRDLQPVLEALFGYRNRMLHSGFEWPPEVREKFANHIRSTKGWRKDWFECAKTGGKPWVWYMSEKFIARVLKLIDQVLDAAGQHIRLHYEAEETPSEG